MGLFGFSKRDFGKNTNALYEMIKSSTETLCNRNDVKENEGLLSVLKGINNNIAYVYNWRKIAQKGKETQIFEDWLFKFANEITEDISTQNNVGASIKLVALTKILYLMSSSYEFARGDARSLYNIANVLSEIMKCVDVYKEGEKEQKALRKEYADYSMPSLVHTDYATRYNAILHKQGKAIDFIREKSKEYNEMIKRFPNEGFFEINGQLYFDVKNEFLKKVKNLTKCFSWYEEEESVAKLNVDPTVEELNALLLTDFADKN